MGPGRRAGGTVRERQSHGNEGLDPGALGSLAPDESSADRFSATYLVALAARSIRELAGLLDRARTAGKRLATAGLSAEVTLAEPGDFNAFVADLSEAVAEVVARHQSSGGGGRTFRVLAGTYPVPETSEER